MRSPVHLNLSFPCTRLQLTHRCLQTVRRKSVYSLVLGPDSTSESDQSNIHSFKQKEWRKIQPNDASMLQILTLRGENKTWRSLAICVNDCRCSTSWNINRTTVIYINVPNIDPHTRDTSQKDKWANSQRPFVATKHFAKPQTMGKHLHY